MRQVHHLVQGSPEWHTHRNTPGIANGSEIYVKMGIPGYTTRAKLLQRDATGITEEVDAHTQRRFDRGHKDEALARPIAEELIGDDLSALVMTDTIDGVLFSVSLDGITQGYDITFEHKGLNKELAAALDAGIIPEQYRPQCEAGLMVSGATRCLFMASKWSDDDVLIEEKHCWYEPNLELRPRMIAAEKQYAIDKANYQHVEQTVATVAATIEAMPALFVQVEGKVLATNLDAFKASAQTFIDNIKTELVNDQDFADADKMVKFLKDGEERLALAKSQALAQTASIDELFRTVDAISEQMRVKRLALDKLVKAEKENRRNEIVTTAMHALTEHVAGLNKRIGGQWVPPMNGLRFSESIKGLKSLDSMRDKVAGALANAKIEANEIADRIEANKKAITVDGANYNYLVHDFAQICTKAPEDFSAIMAQRIAAHKAAEAEKAESAKKAEEARIAAAVEAERKAGEARAAEAVRVAAAAEAEKIRKEEAAKKAEDARVAAINAETGWDGKPADHLAGAGKVILAPEEKRAVLVDAGDEVRAYLNTLDVSDQERGRLRAVIMGYEQFKSARALAQNEAEGA